MAKKAKNIIIKQGLDEWVMTYGDMMSLLLTFFVLIVSFSSMQESKFHQAASSLRSAFGVMSSPESVIVFDTPLVPQSYFQSKDADLLYEVRNVEKKILEDGLQDEVAVEVKNDGVLFRIQAPFMFDSGSARLKAPPRDLLAQMAGMFNKFPFEVAVQGHTDNVPIRSSQFPSNWELSAARAVAVARYFQSLGVPPENLSATGYGEFRPLAGNDTAAGRAKNRRVEVFLKLDRKKLDRQKQLPLAEGKATGTAARDEQAENKPERPIIDPVTSELFRGGTGILPLNGK